MKFTGERYLSTVDSPEISYEHWHRYLYASQFVKDQVVLDIACGEGYGTFLLSKDAQNVVGIDISQEAVLYASSRYLRENLEFKVGTAASIPIEGEKLFDVITSFETIEHISEDEQHALLREVKRLLKPNGIFIVSTPNKLIYSDLLKRQNKFHVQEFYVQEFQDFLETAFKNVILLGQKIFPVSYIWHPYANQGHLREYCLLHTNHGFQPTDHSKDMLYVLAVCSDDALNEIPFSVLVDVSERVIKQRDEQLQQMIQLIQRMENTLSWKITRPLRWLRNLT